MYDIKKERDNDRVEQYSCLLFTLFIVSLRDFLLCSIIHVNQCRFHTQLMCSHTSDPVYACVKVSMCLCTWQEVPSAAKRFCASICVRVNMRMCVCARPRTWHGVSSTESPFPREGFGIQNAIQHFLEHIQ